MGKQQELGIEEKKKIEAVGDFKFEIRGQPMLKWDGWRPFTGTQYFPAQEKERYGDETEDGWINQIYWGDNLQVMSHLLKKYRNKVNLIYIDPPFDSKADYKKTIKLRGQTVGSDHTSFEEKQYADIWTNDDYLQFMYERLILCKELLSDDGCIYLHCDWHRVHHLRCILDDVLGADNARNEIIWCYRTTLRCSEKAFGRDHDNILFYTKSSKHIIHPDRKDFPVSEETIKRWADYADENGFVSNKHFAGSASTIIDTSDETKGFYINRGIPRDWWEVSANVAKGNTSEVAAGKYPTQKPEALLERIIKASSNPGDIVFDCFMGSGTTQAVAMKLGRRFIGADINLGAIQTTTKRLLGVAEELNAELPNKDEPKYTGFAVYNVNNYDVFRNPAEAKDLLVQALELQPLPGGSLYDGEKDEWFYKIMPVNRLATKADLNEIVTGFDWKRAEKKALESPSQPVLKLRLVCMGHEPDLKASLEEQLKEFKIEVEVVDIMREKSELVFKRDSEAKIVRAGGKVKIKAFYPMNLMKKLSLQKSKVGEWREMVDSVMVDFNYDGAVFTPSVVDVPEDGEFVKGEYTIPKDAGTIRVKITDLLSESLEMEVE